MHKMCGIEEKKGREKEEKKEEGKIGNQIAKKKEQVHTQVFPLRKRLF